MPPPAQADLADSGHSGRAELVEELELAGRLLEEEVDDLSGRDGGHKGGVRCGGREGRQGGSGAARLRALGPRGEHPWFGSGGLGPHA